MDKLRMHSPDLTEQNVAKIAELFPNCVTESRDEKGNVVRAVDFDLLRQELSPRLVEGPQERYRLDWPGKREALLAANAPIAKTLRPCREESVDFDTTRNLFIEGDNLDALKLLQETYLGKVKMIYIDPPYNTGNDFIYEDDFAIDNDTYLFRSNQKDEAGNRMTDNPKSNGRFHSDWLSMLYPRIRLAKNLLHESGIIFISIDDNEAANLIEVCDEIFGTENFLGSLSWIKKRKGSFLSKKIISITEWVLVYGKSPDVKLFGGKADDGESQPLIKRTNPVGILRFPPNTIRTKLPDGVYKKGMYGEGTSAVDLLNSIKVDNGIIVDDFALKGPFIWGQSYLDQQIANGATLTINTRNFQIRAFKAPDPESFKGLLSIINGVELGATNEDGYEEMVELLGGENIMSYPKPRKLIELLIKAQTYWDKDATVMDFFSGSATTAHAVMSLNAQDKGARKFVMVQIAENLEEGTPAFKAGYNTISQIGKERIRRSGEIIKKQLKDKPDVDVGFRVLKIDSSNMEPVYYAPDESSQSSLMAQIDNVREGRTSEDLLFQALLESGVSEALTLPIKREQVSGKEVFLVDGDVLAACFEGGIDDAFTKALAARKPLRVVFRDSGFVDSAAKINAEQIFKQLSPSTELKVI